jgi:hypothetical protein
MSASSSIAAARRRRAGGAGGPTPQNKPPPPPQQTTASNVPVNPLTILQQHHAKIIKLEQIIQELVSKETTRVNSSSVKTDSSISSKSTDINIGEISDLIMSRVEQQLDLKAFYDNDERLMNEIEGLKGIIQSQQMVINGFNNTLYTIVDKLNITAHVLDETNNNDDTSSPSFPKSVLIDEANNSIKEFIASELQEDNTNGKLDESNEPNDSNVDKNILDHA